MIAPTVQLARAIARLAKVTRSPHAVTTVTGELVPGPFFWRDAWTRIDPIRAGGFAQAIAHLRRGGKIGNDEEALLYTKTGNNFLSWAPKRTLARIREGAIEMQRLIINANVPDAAGVVHVISALQIPTGTPVAFRLVDNRHGQQDLRIHSESWEAIQVGDNETTLAAGSLLREEGRIHWNGRFDPSGWRSHSSFSNPRTGWMHYTLEDPQFNDETQFFRATEAMKRFFGNEPGSFFRYHPMLQAAVNLVNRLSPSMKTELAIASAEKFDRYRVVHPAQLAYPKLSGFFRTIEFQRPDRRGGEATVLELLRTYRRTESVPKPYFVQLVSLADTSIEVRAEERFTNRRSGKHAREALLTDESDTVLASAMMVIGEEPGTHRIDIHGSPSLGKVAMVIDQLALLGIEAVSTGDERFNILE